MKVPISWLNDYVRVDDLTVEELAEKLTFSGIEVEGIEVVGAELDDKFVVGEIVECERHPNADRLTVCKVSDGEEIYQVVCGAPNARAGLKTAFAKVGAVIPEGGFEIKKAKLRGVESFGMLCSARELKASDEHEGIMEFDERAVAGTALRRMLPEPETVMDLEITWNRPDCLSIIGVAREFAALLQRQLMLPYVGVEMDGEEIEKRAKVRVEDPELCPRYTARMVSFEERRETPPWMRRRLEICGVRPLGLMVDVTNYVLLECGQPLHAFDFEKLAEGELVIRRAAAGELLRTLDGEERKLDTEMLVIADSREAVAVAGVMGGADSEVGDDTKTVLLESALFAAPSVKKTASGLAMHTEASHRFERGVDPDLADWASRRAASLFKLYGKAVIGAGVLDVDNRPAARPPVELRFERARRVIGLPLTGAEMVALLARLGIKKVEDGDERALFTAPSWRIDIECEADLIEEVARLHGLDKLPELTPSAIAVPGADDAPVRVMARCRETLLGFGLSEATHYSFLSEGELNNFGDDAESRLVLPNPVSADYGVMRDSLLPQLVQSLGRNHSRQVEAPGLFEIGRVFGRDAEGQPCEETRLALGFIGPFGRGELDRRRGVENDEAIGWLKGMVVALLRRLKMDEAQFELVERAAFEDGWGVEIKIAGEVAGYMGLIKQKIRHAWRVNQPLAVAELHYAKIVAKADSRAPLVPVPAFPSVARDLAFMVVPGITYEQIVASIRKSAPSDLTNVRLFDIFRGKEKRSAVHSMAFTLEFRSTERTLTDEEVNAAVAKIVAAVKRDLSIDVRES